MDPESPFAHLGSGSVDDRRIGLREIVINLCVGCTHRWATPVADPGSKCPNCGGTEIKKSVPYREAAPRV